MKKRGKFTRDTNIIGKFRTILLCIVASTKIGVGQFYHKEVAVIYDDESFLKTHSAFIDVLKDFSFEGLDFIIVTNSSGKIVEYDKLMYNHVVVVTNQKTKWSSLGAQILQFADIGGNVFLIAGPGAGRESSKLIEEFGFVDKPDHIVIDYNSVNIDKDGVKQRTVIVDATEFGIKSKPIFPKNIGKISYYGRGFDYLQDNPHTFPIITASDTAILARPDESYNKNSALTGTNIILVGGVEMRNSARMVLVGSYNMFSDKSLFGGEAYNMGNMDLLFSLTQWVFQKSGVLRLTNPVHKLVATQKSLDEYIVETEIEYSVCIEELKDGVWKPFIRDDLQLQLFRLTTFGFLTYNYTDKCVYNAKFFLPDYIGTFRLRTDFKQFGYTTLNHEVKIIVRPRRHNDYQRFIFGAYPYYLTSFGMMGMAFCLVFVLINQKQEKEKSS